MEVDEVFSRTDSSGTSSFLTDALGSTLALADSSGAVQTSYTYDPFGNPSSSGTSSSNTQEYTGRESDGTGLQYNRARYYSPTLQRFISEDPLGFGGGDPNLYAYAGNDPLNATDPSGQFIELAGQCLVGAAISAGLGYATSSLAGRKYTWGAAAGDAAIGCALAVVDPFAVVGEGSALVGDVVADDGVAVAGGASSSLASGGEEAAVSDAAAGTCSFSGDTPVATRSGETPIDQLQPGDQVEAYDPATGETGPQPITAVWQHTDQVIEDVTVDGDAIETTPEHPFAVVGTGWVPAGALWVGAQVRREDGSVAVVQTISFAQQSQEMYNLTVATAHTFFVGQQRVLVHNTCDFIVTPNGEAIPVPDGATGPTITKNGKGFMFEGGSGGKGMDPRTVNIRVMDPNPQNPNGYVNYGNNAWQAVDRWTGKTISTKSPLWHISLK